MLFLVILILSVLSAYILPWWAAAIIAFLAAMYFGERSGPVFREGFGALFTAWALLALIKSIPNNNMLAGRVSHLFFLPNWISLLLVTALIGGLVGGTAALSGLWIKKIFQKQNSDKD